MNTREPKVKCEIQKGEIVLLHCIYSSSGKDGVKCLCTLIGEKCRMNLGQEKIKNGEIQISLVNCPSYQEVMNDIFKEERE